MASLELRNKKYRVVFMLAGRKHGYALDTTDDDTAQAFLGGVEKTLMLIRQGALLVPAGADVAEFVKHGGHPPRQAHEGAGTVADAPVTFTEFQDKYLAAVSGGAMEANSLATARMHLRHFGRTLGPSFDMRRLALSDLQKHLNARRKSGDPQRKKPGAKPISPVTLRLEVSTLKAAWNWAVLDKVVAGPFPSKGLQYPKEEERPPFMTLDEFKRRVEAGADSTDLAECIYLRKEEIPRLLDHVAKNATAPWLHPLVAAAAYTGARRSELLRMEVADVDLAAGTVLVREKKRSRMKRTTRHVSMPPALAAILRAWLAAHPGGKALFCQAGVVPGSKKRGKTTGHRSGKRRASSEKGRMQGVRAREEQPPAPVSRDEAGDHLKRTLAGSGWAVLKGYHTLRHSFISCLAADGVDQRIIDDLVGHCSDEQRRRYRHLVPDVKQDAVRRVFG